MNIGGIPTLVICNRTLIHNGVFNINLSFTGESLYDTNCRTLLNGKESAACKPAESIAYKYKGAIFLHEKVTYMRVEPASGETLFTLKLGEECPIGESLAVKGNVVYKAPALEKEEVIQLFYPLPTGLFADELKVGKNKVTLESEKGFGYQLAKPNEGLAWKGVA